MARHLTPRARLEISAILFLSAASAVGGFMASGMMLDPVDINWTYCAGAANGWNGSYSSFRTWVVANAPELEVRTQAPSQESLVAHFQECLKSTEYLDQSLADGDMSPIPRRLAKDQTAAATLASGNNP